MEHPQPVSHPKVPIAWETRPSVLRNPSTRSPLPPCDCVTSPEPASIAALRRLRTEGSPPPPPPRRSRRWPSPFPLRFGQQLACLHLPRDAFGVCMTATPTVALRIQQRVGIHRQQEPVADRTCVCLRWPASCRPHVPPTHWIRHRARLRPTEAPLSGAATRRCGHCTPLAAGATSARVASPGEHGGYPAHSSRSRA